MEYLCARRGYCRLDAQAQALSISSSARGHGVVLVVGISVVKGSGACRMAAGARGGGACGAQRAANVSKMQLRACAVALQCIPEGGSPVRTCPVRRRLPVCVSWGGASPELRSCWHLFTRARRSGRSLCEDAVALCAWKEQESHTLATCRRSVLRKWPFVVRAQLPSAAGPQFSP